MTRRGLGALVLFAMLAFLLGGGSQLSASAQSGEADRLREEIRRAQQRLEQIQREQRETQRDLQRTQQQKNSLSGELDRLDQELTATEQKLEITRARLEDAQRRLRDAVAALEEAEANLAEREKLLKRRLRALSEHGSVAYLDVLLAARSFGDFLTRYEFLQQIVDQDFVLLEEVQEQRRELAQRKQIVEIERDQIVLLEDRLEQEKQQYEVMVAERRETLSELSENEEALRAALDEQERSTQAITDLLNRMQRELAALLPGQVGAMIWPVDRSGSFRLSSSFGPRYHPILRISRLHAGADFAKPSGSSIYAAAPGRVVQAGWLGGYGNTVVIAHTPTISTLYAHASRLLVSAGDQVKAGQEIARVGMTGLATGPHLHFEVRKNGNPVDPMDYLP